VAVLLSGAMCIGKRAGVTTKGWSRLLIPASIRRTCRDGHAFAMRDATTQPAAPPVHQQIAADG
jgi:hypothetical protein